MTLLRMCSLPRGVIWCASESRTNAVGGPSPCSRRSMWVRGLLFPLAMTPVSVSLDRLPSIPEWDSIAMLGHQADRTPRPSPPQVLAHTRLPSPMTAAVREWHPFRCRAILLWNLLFCPVARPLSALVAASRSQPMMDSSPTHGMMGSLKVPLLPFQSQEPILLLLWMAAVAQGPPFQSM